jgi:hypothetical protein
MQKLMGYVSSLRPCPHLGMEKVDPGLKKVFINIYWRDLLVSTESWTILG